jgi:membrane peptidoglycan carboxypeptidase
LKLFWKAVLILGIVAGGVWVYGKYNDLGSIKDRITTPSQGSIVYDRNGQEMFRYYDAGEKREIVAIEDIPESMQLAVIAMEDENFYYNEDGIPWSNLVGSALRCLKPSSGECRGGSGLSQQLIKKTITNRTTATLDNKVNELLGAYKFNQEVTKQDVIRLYLNVVPFGRNTYGVQEAAKSYFGKNINEKKDGKFTLSIPEACFIGSMLPKPESFAVAIKDRLNGKDSDDWQILLARKNICIEKLGKNRVRGEGKDFFIRESDIADLQKIVPKFLAYKSDDQKFGHIKNFITEELVGKYKSSKTANPYGFKGEEDLLTRGLKIKTTFDLKIQKELEDTVKNGVANSVIPNGGNNAASVVLDGPTGQIIAMVGSVDFNNKKIQGEVNMLTSARQPGSSIKPFVYASAFNNGFNPATMIIDTATDFGKYAPLNFDKKFNGPVSMRYALQNSLNIPAVKALYLSADESNNPDGEGGLNNFKKFVSATGDSFPYWEAGTCGVASALGGCEVRMLDHATGINTLLQEGKKMTASPFLEIVSVEKNFVNGSSTTQDLYNLAMNSKDAPYPKIDNAIDPLVARQVANVMSDYQARDINIWGNTKDNLILDDWVGDNQVAAKTGTTNDYKDAWTVGGTPYYTVVVWTGNTNGDAMYDKVASASIAGPIWHDVMEFLHKDKVKKGFSKEGLEPVGINSYNGLLQEGGKTEYLSKSQIAKLKGFKYPTEDKSSIFYTRTPIISTSVKINKLDGKLAPDSLDFPAYLVGYVNCGSSGSEFPVAKNWQLGVGGSIGKCPTEKSTFSAEQIRMSLDTNFQSGQSIGRTLSLSVRHPGGSVRIQSIDLRIGGQSVGSVQDAVGLNLDVSSISGYKDVQVVVVDEFGNQQSFVYPNVLFGSSISSSSNCEVGGLKIMLLPGQACPNSNSNGNGNGNGGLTQVLNPDSNQNQNPMEEINNQIQDQINQNNQTNQNIQTTQNSLPPTQNQNQNQNPTNPNYQNQNQNQNQSQTQNPTQNQDQSRSRLQKLKNDLKAKINNFTQK